MSELFLDRTPPHNIEAEQAVLGAIFLDPEVLYRVMELITPQDFYKTSHQRIYQAMVDLSALGEPVDIVTVTAELNKRKWLEEAGGVSYLSDLANAVPTAANVEYYARIVEEKAILRRLIKTATQIVTTGYTSADDVEEILSEAEKSILEIRDARSRDGFTHIKDVLRSAYERIEALHASGQEVTGIPSGYKDLDRLTSGFQPSDLVIVAARPSVGKTAFALNVAQNVAVRGGQTVAIFSLEMSAAQLVQRMLCAEGNIDANRMRTGTFRDEDWEKLTMAIASLSQAQLYIDDTPGIHINQIRAKARRLKAEQGLGLVVIDYLQLIQGHFRENRQQEISAISRSLKAMARELNCTVLALSQLSRAVEQRQDKRPMLSDLRESGSIEQDADVVAFLYREDYYDDQTENQNIVEIIVAKQRNGPVGKVELAFLKEYNKFVNLSRHDESMASGA